MALVKLLILLVTLIANEDQWGKVGSITVGKYADIIAVESNPLDDVSVLENVKFVMKGGRVYKNIF